MPRLPDYPGLPGSGLPSGLTQEVEVATSTFEGYVWKYKLQFNEYYYFTVTISKKHNLEEDLEECMLARRYEESDVSEGGKIYSVKDSAISMAMIATLKEAFIHKKKVKLICEMKISLGKQAATYLIREVEILQN